MSTLAVTDFLYRYWLDFYLMRPGRCAPGHEPGWGLEADGRGAISGGRSRLLKPPPDPLDDAVRRAAGDRAGRQGRLTASAVDPVGQLDLQVVHHTPERSRQRRFTVACRCWPLGSMTSAFGGASRGGVVVIHHRRGAGSVTCLSAERAATRSGHEAQ